MTLTKGAGGLSTLFFAFDIAALRGSKGMIKEGSRAGRERFCAMR